MLEAYNCGAWDTETTMMFSLRAGRSSHVDAADPKKLANPARFREVSMMSVDHMLQGDAATFIKYDVEGSEKQAIDGAKKTITAHRAVPPQRGHVRDTAPDSGAEPEIQVLHETSPVYSGLGHKFILHLR